MGRETTGAEGNHMRGDLVVDCRNAHGEGVFWSPEHQLLYWTDITGGRVWTHAPASRETRSHAVAGEIGCFATRKDRPWHDIVAAFKDGFAFVDLRDGIRHDIAPIEADLPTTRLNDGRTDRQGRFIAGTYNEDELKPIGSVWRLDPDLTITRLFGGVGCSNGACFSADGKTFWFADSGKGDIEAFDNDIATGTPANRRVVARTKAPGFPDGSCIDAEGFVWNAVWEGYRVDRYAPDGRLDRSIAIPVRKPTCCAFGGADLSTLYITTSRLGEDDAILAREPTAGGLYAVRPGVTGLADMPFAG